MDQSATQPTQQSEPSVVRGTFLIFSSWADVLVDTGASHSFLAQSFVSTLGLETEELRPGMSVETPVGGRVSVDRICRGCALTILDRTLV